MYLAIQGTDYTRYTLTQVYYILIRPGIIKKRNIKEKKNK